jgi:hypothetical protein
MPQNTIYCGTRHRLASLEVILYIYIYIYTHTHTHTHKLIIISLIISEIEGNELV